jgi:hypothetical protein
MSFCTGRACLRQSRDGHPARRSQKVPIWSGRTCTQAALRRDRRSVWIVVTDRHSVAVFGRTSGRRATIQNGRCCGAALRPPERAVGCCRRYDFSPRRSLPIQQRASPMRKPARSAPTSAAASPKSTSSTRRIAPISTSRASFARRRSCTVGSWTTRRCPRSIRAVEIGSGHFGWYMRLARALERSGQTRVALSHRRHAQRIRSCLPSERRRDRRCARDARLGAADHYQRLAKRWPRDPAFALRLARARLLADPAATGGKCDAALPESFGIKASATLKNAEHLLTLAYPGPACSPPARCARLVREMEDDKAARSGTAPTTPAPSSDSLQVQYAFA